VISLSQWCCALDVTGWTHQPRCGKLCHGSRVESEVELVLGHKNCFTDAAVTELMDCKMCTILHQNAQISEKYLNLLAPVPELVPSCYYVKIVPNRSAHFILNGLLISAPSRLLSAPLPFTRKSVHSVRLPTTNQPWNGRGQVTWPIFKFCGPQSY